MALLPESIHVLLVDDEQLSRFVVGNLLRKCNYAVTVVDSGAQALDLLSRSAPGTFQLILTDLMMPEVDGLDILRYVRSNIQLAGLPVIMMSANEQKDTVFQAIKGGAEEYLVKPVTRKEVQNIWQHVWKRLQAAEQEHQHQAALAQQQQHQQQQPVPSGTPAQALEHIAAQAAGATLPQPRQQQQAQQNNAAASAPALATGTAATAAAGAAAAIHRAGSSRGVRHLQQQQKLLQQQHQQHQLQQARQHLQQQQQQSVQQSAQQQELLQSMQQLHQAQQPAVFQPDRCNTTGNLHSQLLMGKLPPAQQQLAQPSLALQQQKQLQQQQGVVSLQQGAVSLQQQQKAQQEDFESLAFFLSTLHGHRAAEAAQVRSAVAELDAQIAQVQAALQRLQPSQPQQQGVDVQQQQQQHVVPDSAGQAAAVGGALARPGSAGSNSNADGNTAPPSTQGAAAAATAVALTQPPQPPPTAAGAAADNSKRRMQQRGDDDGDNDTEDEDDLEMERRERSRRHKRQRVGMVMPATTHQQQPGGGGAAADVAGQLQLLRRASSTLSGVQQLGEAAAAAIALQGAAAGDAAAAAAEASAAAATEAAAAAAGVPSSILAKWQHVSSKFDTLEAIYLQRKHTQQQPQQDPASTAAAAAAGTSSKAEQSSKAALLLPPQHTATRPGGRDPSTAVGWGGQGSLPAFLQGFGDDLWGYSRYSRLAVRGTVRASADLLGGGSAMVCAAAFDRDDEYVATAGVSKRIRIFEYGAITSGMCGAHGCTAANNPGAGAGAYGGAGGGSCSSLSGSESPLGWGGGAGGAAAAAAAAAQDSGAVVYPVLELSSRSRLSCVAWSPYVKAQLASSDYEGVVQLWDANTGTELMQLEEHSKRAWAVDFSRLEPTRLVSSSDDGTVKLWSIHQETSVGTLQLHANVCSVQFSPESPHLLAAGCANYRFYLYDLRNTSQPLVCVPGHRRAVSYVRWLDGQQLITASTDNTLRRWSVPDLLSAGSASASASREIGGAAAAGACKMTYRGHTNNRNFIGLTVLPGAPGASPTGGNALSGSSAGGGGYIVCGSETNEAYVYHSAVPLPVTAHSFAPLSQPWGYHQRAQKQGGRKTSCSDLGALADLTDAAAGGKSDLFVSCVAWNRRQGTVVAANSAGHIQVLELA